LELDTGSPEESDWTMMAILSIGSLLEFGKATGQLRKVGGLGAHPTEKNLSLEIERDATATINSQNRKRWADQEDEDRVMGVPEDEDHDSSHLSRPMQALTTESADSPSQNQAQFVFSLALDVTFATLSHLLKNPSMPARTSYIKPPLNPYITVILTFVSTLFKNAAVVHLMERSVPWAGLASLLSAALQRAGGPRSNSVKDAGKFAAGQLLPEDWCVRGMEWAGRRVYERGFWKVQGPACQGEMDVIAHPSIGVAGGRADFIDGIVEEEGEEEMDWEAGVSSPQPLASLRWKRLRSTAEMLIKAVPGFEWDGSTIIVTGKLAQKVAMWEKEAQREVEESRARKHHRSGSEMQVDEDEEDDYDGEDVAGDESDDPEDSAEVKELKVISLLDILNIQIHSLLRLGPATIFTNVITVF
jgi:protein SMG6